MASTQESSSRFTVDDDVVYVAVGKNVEESKLNLMWALTNFPEETRFCILHVHQPARTIPLIGGNFSASRLEQHEVAEFHELERRIMLKIMDDYLLLCHQETQVQAEKMIVEMDEVGNGIVELVYQNGIKKLVMGAAADKYYTQEMRTLKSRKAKYVRQCTPHSCEIWFICKGCLVDSGSTETFVRESYENNGLEITEVYEVPSTEEGNDTQELYYLLDQAMLEAEYLKQETLEESNKRRAAEKIAVNATRRANALETLYSKELKQRKETEEMLVKEKEDHRTTKNHCDEERVISIGKILLLEVQVGTLENELKELQDTVLTAVNQCKEYEKEMDELQEEHRRTLSLAEELQTQLAGHASSLQILPMFSLDDIDEATDNFNQSNKIGEGGYGTIYKGFIFHTAVAIKVLNGDSMQGAAEFQQEVNVLGKLRHPNLVTLIGACQESCALIYEYMPNGNLEDRLNCKNDTPPLPWQARIRLATELCSVLIFLHSSKPNSIVHGDLKPSNILLDANLGCKLSDFGICRALPGSGNNAAAGAPAATLYHITDPKGTFHYLDPHFLTTGELSPKSDTYSFGIILLQLLTGKPALGIANETRLAMNEGSLRFLDQSAGDWPFLQAKQLARLGLTCCDMDRSRRPDLASEVWRVLERMRGSWVSSSLSWSGSHHHRDLRQPPPHFFCPILQEVMVDPHVAADGFTYEAEALRGWFEGGHGTSPMTNLELDHFNLVPNRSLRSAIQEWLQ
ncbi:U-box domain-containing protein 33 [Linum perenne]